MSEYKLSENNWTRVAVFAGGNRGHYRTDFDAFVGVDRARSGSWKKTYLLL